jgi:hypothetical protein
MNTSDSNQYHVAQDTFGDVIANVSSSDHRFPPEVKAFMSGLTKRDQHDIIGVHCGSEQNLCAIVLPSFEPPFINLKNFVLAANPRLKNSAITRFGKFDIVWLRIEGWRPANHVFPGGLWISNGMLPVVSATETRSSFDACFVQVGPIVTFGFHDLIWPLETHENFILEFLESEHGKLFRHNTPIANTCCFDTAAYFMKVRHILRYDRNEDSFSLLVDTNERRTIDYSELTYTIFAWISEQAKKCGVQYPSGEPEVAIINVLKNICPPASAENRYGLALPT